ncbi:MAG: ROK family protein [Clostridia bacterium]|nr:ROK family protein [Clostridia bacterium]
MHPSTTGNASLRLGALEAGGTKMVMSILDQQGVMLERVSIPTRTPQETMPEMIAFFRDQQIGSLGVGCFGPLDLNPASPAYGCITATPKLDWRNYPLLDEFRRALNVPVLLDTDVNGAALAESRLGAAQGLGSCVYVTIGTGIGGGLIIGGECVHGLMHPEMGHQLLTPHPEDPSPEGFCPYHRRCLEGLASGPAIMKRWGIPAQELPEDHPAWQLEAYYLAQMCHNAMMTFSPEKIILGGGVMHKEFLFPMIREKTLELLGGYISSPAVDAGLADYIVSPGLGDNSGVMGAWLLARRAYEEGGN